MSVRAVVLPLMAAETQKPSYLLEYILGQMASPFPPNSRTVSPDGKTLTVTPHKIISSLHHPSPAVRPTPQLSAMGKPHQMFAMNNFNSRNPRSPPSCLGVREPGAGWGPPTPHTHRRAPCQNAAHTHLPAHFAPWMVFKAF